MRDFRELFQRIPNDGKTLHALRNFNFRNARNGQASSVLGLAEELGLEVAQVPMRPGMGGRLVSDAFAESGYSIEVNKSHSVESRRFSVLHEIGHFLMHVDRADPLFDGLNLSRSQDEFYFDVRMEKEANDFADLVLFGDQALQAAVSSLGLDYKRLAYHFGVSENMIQVAIKKFGVINP